MLSLRPTHTPSEDGEFFRPRHPFRWLEPLVPRPTAPVLDASTTVDDARMALIDDGAQFALVVEQGRPIGVVTSRALRGRGGRRPHVDSTVAELMDFELVTADRAASARHARQRRTA